MQFAEIERLASSWFNPRLEEQRPAFPRAVQAALGEATSRGMALSPPTYFAVEKLAQQEVEQRGRTMLNGYQQALSATAGIVPQDIVTSIKEAFQTALVAEAKQVHSAIQSVRDAIKPAQTKTAADLCARPLQKIVADFDLFWANLNTERGVPTFGFKPSSASMRTFAIYEGGQLSTQEGVQNLVGRMFLQPETEIRYYYQNGTTMDEPLVEAINAGDILIQKSEFRFFKDPEDSHDYIKIEKGDYKADWQKQAAEFTPEFVQAILELSVKKRSELEIVERVHLEDHVREQLKKQKWAFDIFLSYSALDQEPASLVYDKVIAAGGRIFMAPKEIQPGDDFAATIRNVLIHSKELWLLLSPNSIKSEWVTTEWGAAWVLEKKIVPILYRCDHNALPDRLRGTHSIDLHRIDAMIANRFPSDKSKP
jgi:TIR domain